MLRTILVALAQVTWRSLQALSRWYAAQWRRHRSPLARGALAALALVAILASFQIAGSFLSGVSSFMLAPTAARTPAASATLTPMATATYTPLPTPTGVPSVTPNSTPIPTVTSLPTPTPLPTPAPTLAPTVELTEPPPTVGPTRLPATVAPPPDSDCAYIGNGNADSMIFHYPSCSYVARMSESNKVCLSSRAEAIERGFTPCKVCNP